MKIFVLRHADALCGIPDHLREISQSGEDQIGSLCRRLNPQIFDNLTNIWCSKYLRAKQSAELFKEKMGLPTPITAQDNISPNDNPEALAIAVAKMTNQNADLMIVSHNPFVAHFTQLLLGDSQNRAEVFFDTSCMVCLKCRNKASAENRFGEWRLEFRLSPQDLK